jgi:hypothetical protein
VTQATYTPSKQPGYKSWAVKRRGEESCLNDVKAICAYSREVCITVASGLVSDDGPPLAAIAAVVLRFRAFAVAVTAHICT